jgi:hypothetical protein
MAHRRYVRLLRCPDMLHVPQIDLIVGQVVSGCRFKILGLHTTCDTIGLGCIRVFLVIIFGLDRVGSDYFLSSGENFSSCQPFVWSGHVKFFSDGLGRIYRVEWPMIRSKLETL